MASVFFVIHFIKLSNFNLFDMSYLYFLPTENKIIAVSDCIILSYYTKNKSKINHKFIYSEEY